MAGTQHTVPWTCEKMSPAAQGTQPMRPVIFFFEKTIATGPDKSGRFHDDFFSHSSIFLLGYTIQRIQAAFFWYILVDSSSTIP